MKPVEVCFLKQKEPYQSIMLYIRSIILKMFPEIEERISYNIPFYYSSKKPLLYLNILKNTEFVDVAFVQGVLFEKDFPILKNYKERKQVRSIQVFSLEEFDENEFIELLKVATEKLSISSKAWFI